MAEYIEYHPLKFWLDPASIAEIVAHIQTYLVNNPINSTTEIETIIHDYLIAHPELIGVESVNGKTGDVILTADDIDVIENITIKTVLDELKDDFNNTIIATPSNNLLNPENIISGHTYGTSVIDGRRMITLSENEAFSCGYIDIIQGGTYSITGISYAVYNGDAEGYAIGIANATTSGSVANPPLDTSNVRSNYNNTDKIITRLYFSWRNDVFSPETYMANRGALLPFEPYGESTLSLAPNINVSSENIKEEIYYVDLNGNGDFTSLMSAFVALKDNEKSKTIYVLSGEYDIYQEIGGDDFVNSIPADATSYWDYVTLVPKNTKVIGVGGVTLKYMPESVPNIASQFISPINISDGDVYIENFKIVCKNCRYGIHDQTRTNAPKGYKHIYKNISVIKDSSSEYTGKAQAFGGGMNKSAKFIFESCVFQSNRLSWSLHNAHDGSGDVVFRNCAFNNLLSTRNAYPSIRFGNVSGIQTHINVNISGCYFNDGINVTNESSVERPNAFDITMINCIGNTTITVENQTNIYTPQIFNT